MAAVVGDAGAVGVDILLMLLMVGTDGALNHVVVQRVTGATISVARHANNNTQVFTAIYTEINTLWLLLAGPFRLL